jgi:protein-S-isoprenylcysteine O-methyltransferase Ste14
VVDTLLFSGFALHHSVFARPSVKRGVGQLVPGDLERSFYVIVASVLFMAVLVFWQPVPGLAWRTTGLLAYGLGATQVLGLALTGYAASRLGVTELAGLRSVRSATASSPYPSATPPPALRDNGIYGFVRHPIYFAWLLMVWPAPVMTGSRLLFAALSTAYLMVAIPLEERTLVRDFGPAYVAYQKKVRWRMVPGVY